LSVVSRPPGRWPTGWWSPGRPSPGVFEAIGRSFAASPRDADEALSYLEGLRAEYLRQYELAIQE